MVILITGDTGLLGTNLKNRFRKTKHKIYGISRRREFDLNDASIVERYVNLVKPDVIYHLAANVAKPIGEISPIDMTQRNIGIFVNVLRSAINTKVKRFIYTSSISVYGEVKVPYKENGDINPQDVYGVNKLACEQILKIMAKVYDFNYVILRLHNLYGPHQNMNDPYKNVVASLMRKLMEGKPYKLFGQGKMRRAFSYVDDVVDVLIEALEEKFANKIINVGSNKDISLKELSDMLQEITGLQTDVEMAKARKQEPTLFIADHSLQNSLTKYKETPLREGLIKTWKWVKKRKLGKLEKQESEIYV